MFRKGLMIAALTALMAGPAFGSQCPSLMSEIDAALPNAELSEENKAKVMELRAQGEEQHKAGEHDASVESLNEAKEILGL